MNVYRTAPSVTHLDYHCASCNRKIRGEEWIVLHKALQGDAYGRFVAHVDCLRTAMSDAPDTSMASFEAARDQLVALRESL